MIKTPEEIKANGIERVTRAYKHEKKFVKKKIGILGSHGTGKTTLAYNLAAKHKNENPGLKVGFLSEVVRMCPFSINHDSTIASQLWIYHKQLIEEIELTERSDILICDRTILDNLAYSRNMAKTRDVQFEKIIDACFDQALKWMSTYDTIYFLRPSSPIVADGVRIDDVVFQKEIDNILARWVVEHKIATVQRSADDKIYDNNNEQEAIT